MKTEKQENIKNDEGHSRAETLADLPVTDEQADETKGGPGLPISRDAHFRESTFGNELMIP